MRLFRANSIHAANIVCEAPKSAVSLFAISLKMKLRISNSGLRDYLHVLFLIDRLCAQAFRLTIFCTPCDPRHQQVVSFFLRPELLTVGMVLNFRLNHLIYTELWQLKLGSIIQTDHTSKVGTWLSTNQQRESRTHALWLKTIDDQWNEQLEICLANDFQSQCHGQIFKQTGW